MDSDTFKVSPRLPIYFALILVLSSVFMRDVFNLLLSSVGRGSIAMFVWGVFVVGSIAIVLYFRMLPPRTIGLLLLLLVCGAIYALSFDIFEERVHLIKYGILGWLVCAACAVSMRWQARLSVGFIAAAFVGCCDEFLQSVTPGRVGDLRDVVFDAVGGLWGCLLFLASRVSGTLRSVGEPDRR